MSVDFYSCKNCGSIFSDCGDYVICECGTHWCDYDCATNDGYTDSHCSLGCEVEGQYYDSGEGCIGVEDEDGYISCFDCPNRIEESCKYCREEDYEDSELLDKAMDLLGCDREYLISKMKED